MNDKQIETPLDLSEQIVKRWQETIRSSGYLRAKSKDELLSEIIGMQIVAVSEKPVLGGFNIELDNGATIRFVEDCENPCSHDEIIIPDENKNVKLPAKILSVDTYKAKCASLEPNLEKRRLMMSISTENGSVRCTFYKEFVGLEWCSELDIIEVDKTPNCNLGEQFLDGGVVDNNIPFVGKWKGSE